MIDENISNFNVGYCNSCNCLRCVCKIWLVLSPCQARKQIYIVTYHNLKTKQNRPKKMPHKNAALHRITYECMKNGVEFTVVAFGGVITEASSHARACVGRNLEWLKKELRKGETYNAKEVEKPVPLWLQHKEFEGNWDDTDRNMGKIIVEVEQIEITNPTKLPQLKGVKFI